MYDDILGPIKDEIKLDPKRKKKISSKKAKRTTLRAKLGGQIPTPVSIGDDEDEEEICNLCGNDWEDCECEDLAELLADEDEPDPWANVEEGQDRDEDAISEESILDDEDLILNPTPPPSGNAQPECEPDCDACDGCDSI